MSEHQMTEEVMKEMLKEMGEVLGLQWPETSRQVHFFKNQLPLLVRANAKQAVFWEKECELTRIKTFGR